MINREVRRARENNKGFLGDLSVLRGSKISRE